MPIWDVRYGIRKRRGAHRENSAFGYCDHCRRYCAASSIQQPYSTIMSAMSVWDLTGCHQLPDEARVKQGIEAHKWWESL